MATLLRLDSSADRASSRTRALTHAFAEAWRAHGPDNVVVHRDLHATPLPHLPDAALHFPPRLRATDVIVRADAEALQLVLIDELLAADVLIVGAPMYNYSLPSSLKAWIDHVHVPGLTAPFDGDTQPLAGRPAVVVTARGGSYDPGTATEGWDHATPVLELILGTAFGMRVDVVATNLTLAQSQPLLADQAPRAAAELAEAQEQVRELAERLSADFAGR